ncbi:MAG: sensor histidine kinase [Methanosphaera sp.]|nr:sensor histidine kinase [Methanosphaera sp.]
MSKIKTEIKEVITDDLNIYEKITSNKKVTTDNNSKQGVLLTNRTLTYVEEYNFLDTLGINIEVNRDNLNKLNLNLLANILNYSEFIKDPEIFNKLFNNEIKEIHLENILYKRDEELLYLDINFNTILNEYILITVNDNSNSLEAQVVLEKLVKDNQNLIKELHHRVKNNLQVLLSLISIQERFKKSDYLIKEYLKLSITSMSIMHSQLYSENLTHVSTERILTELKAKCENLYNSSNITFDFKSKNDSQIPIEKANPILLLLDELIINSIYSLKTGNNKIINCTFMTKEDNLIIFYKDNTSKEQGDNDGIGELLIESLISQADGRKGNTKDTGYEYKIIIPITT